MNRLKYKIDENYMPGGVESESRQRGALSQQGRSKHFGTKSYNCKHGACKSCTKMSCPCECHKEGLK